MATGREPSREALKASNWASSEAELSKDIGDDGGKRPRRNVDLSFDRSWVDLWLHWFLEVHSILFVDLVPVYKVVLFALWGATFSSEVSHSSAVEAGSFWFSRGSLGLSDVCSEQTSIESVRQGSGASRCVHRDRLVSHPSWGVV